MMWMAIKHFLEEVLTDISNCFHFGMVSKSGVSMTMAGDLVDFIRNALLSSLNYKYF
jgi:hypothetical protein